jgi:hypothetical protein
MDGVQVILAKLKRFLEIGAEVQNLKFSADCYDLQTELKLKYHIQSKTNLYCFIVVRF